MDEMRDDELDILLARAPVPAVPAALWRRVLADYDRAAGRPGLTRLLRLGADLLWPGAPAWQPVCALALALVIGFGAAAFAPLDLADGGEASAGLFAAPDLDGQGL